MNNISKIEEYIAFMEWLQATHPDVYFACWGFVSEPSNDAPFIIRRDGLDEDTYNAVVDAKFEFFKTHRSLAI